eukprot:gene39942-52730_t
MACNEDDGGNDGNGDGEASSGQEAIRGKILVNILDSLRKIETALSGEGRLQGAIKTDIRMLKAFVSNFM